jgi:hypothetical protein
MGVINEWSLTGGDDRDCLPYFGIPLANCESVEGFVMVMPALERRWLEDFFDVQVD